MGDYSSGRARSVFRHCSRLASTKTPGLVCQFHHRNPSCRSSSSRVAMDQYWRLRGGVCRTGFGLPLGHLRGDRLPRSHIEVLLGSSMARVGGYVRHLYGTTRPELPGGRHDGESTRTAFCRVRRVQYIDVDDEVGRDYGKRKMFLGTADSRMRIAN